MSGHEDAGQGKAAGGLVELGVSRLLRDREDHRGDDLALLQCRGEQALKVVVGGNLALVGDHGGAAGQHRRRIARGGVVVGDAAAKGATVAHRRVADSPRQSGQCGIGFGSLARHHRMRGGGADVQPAIADADALHFGNAGQADQHGGGGKALLHCRDQRLAARQRLRALSAHGLGGIGNRRRFHEVEIVHDILPQPCIADQTRDGETGMSIWVTCV